MTEDPRSVDELRARLRDLGYLDAGVDRFVLGRAAMGRGLPRLAIESSLRIGLLAALLLGPSAAVALGARLSGLVTGPADLLVLALYLAAVAQVAVTAFAFLVIVGLGMAAARGDGSAISATQRTVLPRVAGLAVGVACLAYLVFWWRTTAPPGAAWAGLGWTLAALVGAAGISMLLGHAVMVAAAAALLREGRGVRPVVRRGRSAVATALVWLVAFGGAAGLLGVAGAGERGPGEQRVEPLDRRPTGVRSLVVGIDGFDLAFAERLAREGRLPAIGRLLGGARSEMAPVADGDPASIWTSIATGQPAGVHGILGLEARRLSGLGGAVSADRASVAGVVSAATDLLRLTRPAAVSGLQRRSKTFWEVAGEQGVRVAVVNWWASWPAPEVTGAVVTDRATLRLERGGALDAELTPASLYGALRGEWPLIRDEARRRAVAAFGEVAEPAGDVLRRAAEQDALQLALANRAGLEAAELAAVYLPGLDIAQFGLVGGPGASGLPASLIATRVAALEGYYEFLDRLVAPAVRLVDEGRTVVLVTDPGRARLRGPGLFSVTGAAAGLSQPRGEPTDVAPTLLYLAGLPVSREFLRPPATGLVSDRIVSRFPVRWVARYGRRLIPPTSPGSSPLDEEAMERLRSLGYVR